MRIQHLILIGLSLLFGLFGCNTKKEIPISKNTSISNSITAPRIQEKKNEKGVTHSPQAIIYRMKKNYSKYVPITLSDDKSRVISYPAITDIYYKGKLAYPTQLTNDYWLDNRGINKNTAFIKLTYDAYSKLKKTPSINELFQMIIDKDPLLEIINCGQRSNFNDEVMELNQLIKNNYSEVE